MSVDSSLVLCVRCVDGDSGCREDAGPGGLPGLSSHPWLSAAPWVCESPAIRCWPF